MATTNELSMKLLIDTKAKKVYFAQAGSDVVEFLSSILSLPLGTVTDLLTKDHMVGSVGNVLCSMEKLDANYKSKAPQLSLAISPATLFLLQQLLGAQQLNNGNSNCGDDNGSSSSKRNLVLYTCKGEKQTCMLPGGTCAYFLSAASGSACPGCSSPMNKATGQVLVNAEGYAYTVGDDLSVTQSAKTLSGIVTLLARYGVKDLKEKRVKIGKEEALGILAASLKSKTVLTDVFLRKIHAGGKRRVIAMYSDSEEDELESEEDESDS